MAAELTLENIQGDILGGLPKKTETDFFFKIDNADEFKKQLAQVIPLITTARQVLLDRDAIKNHKQMKGPKSNLIRIAGVNIAFSHTGFEKLSIDDKNLVEPGVGQEHPFFTGQKKDAEQLGDKGTGSESTYVPDWLPEFLGDIHGIIVFTGDTHLTVTEGMNEILDCFAYGTPSSSITKVHSITGDVRPGKFAGHEHFGFLDDISNPMVIGFDTNPDSGPTPVRPGILLLGQDGDSNANIRDPWMVDGSLQVFRYLFQLVPEFDKFLEDNPIKMPGLSPEQGSELLGARLIGRWKSGAPIDLIPFFDDPSSASDPERFNNFSYVAGLTSQKICPFAAHARKTNPRGDLDNQVESNRIMRRGIPFGPEVKPKEKKQNTTLEDRGLIFRCYQTSILEGFRRIQIDWANNPNFPPTQTTQTPGFDAIIGQGPNRVLSGFDPQDPSKELALPMDWVVPRGGEYFFSPSIDGLKFIANKSV
ncbi:hypothetical protein AX15_007804 [Amanita polypyramis BW_CC]|nr:hypothetical protein AX15_007804 [Amanita polypyramis BW_CC]